MILIAYDSSDDAKAAIERAGRLFPGEPTTVLTVWQRFIDTMARVGGGVGALVDFEQIDQDSAKAAADQAQAGSALAREAGLAASDRTAVVETTIADAILSQAREIEAGAVVCGSRGFTGIKSLMLGSVSHALLQHADLPVLVVPSPAVARARTEHRAGLT